ncbi:hypothetical protein BGX30_012585 [Mortierella sp. GBA39]|nr:hypothetical protein BGX30_012585 [Mortierella sp. GBA39]
MPFCATSHGYPCPSQSPPVFTGARDGFSALAWLVAVNHYFNPAKINETEQNPRALSYLGMLGPARWFDGCGDFKTEFTPTFTLEYIPTNFAGACRRHLTNLRMTTNFSTYLTTFKELLSALLGYASTEAAKATINEFAQTSFIDNCPLVLQQMIEGHVIQSPDITLVQIFQCAQEIDRIYSFKPDTGSKTNSRNNACRRCRQTGYYAVDCYIYGDNNNSNRGNSNSNNRGNSNSNNRGNSNSNNRGNNNNRRGRWVYQVAVGDSPESGKASDDQA